MITHRLQDPAVIDGEEMARLMATHPHVTVQFSAPGYAEELLARLDALCAEYGARLAVRFYSHGPQGFDANVLRRLPSARSVLIDCMRKASNLEALSALTRLEAFALGVEGLRERDILAIKALHGVETLTVGPTLKSDLQLGHLREFHKLRDLHICGHDHDIDVVAGLTGIAALSLSGIRKSCDIGFVSAMSNLRELNIFLGGRASIADLTPPELERLRVVRVRALAELGDVGRFERLTHLQIEDQIQLTGIALGPNPELEEIKILNCKSLAGIEGLGQLRKLRHMRIFGTALEYGPFIQQPLPAALDVLAFYTGKKSADAVISNDLGRRGYREFQG